MYIQYLSYKLCSLKGSIIKINRVYIKKKPKYEKICRIDIMSLYCLCYQNFNKGYIQNFYTCL